MYSLLSLLPALIWGDIHACVKVHADGARGIVILKDEPISILVESKDHHKRGRIADSPKDS